MERVGVNAQWMGIGITCRYLTQLRTETFSFLFDMNQLFEVFIAELLCRVVWRIHLPRTARSLAGARLDVSRPRRHPVPSYATKPVTTGSSTSLRGLLGRLFDSLPFSFPPLEPLVSVGQNIDILANRDREIQDISSILARDILTRRMSTDVSLVAQNAFARKHTRASSTAARTADGIL